MYLPKTVAILVSNALVSSRLDYCNSLYRGLSENKLRRLQCLQNMIGRVVTGSHLSDVDSFLSTDLLYHLALRIYCTLEFVSDQN